MTVLTWSEEEKSSSGEKRQKAKTTIQWATQIMLQLKRWARNVPLRVVADVGYCALTLVELAWAQGITFISRLWMDTALYSFPSEHTGARGRPRIKGERLCTAREMFKTQGLPWETHRVQGYGGSMKTLELLPFFCL